MSNQDEVIDMTAESIGKDLLQALWQEVKLMPKPASAMSKFEQEDVIDRLRKRVSANVEQAVRLIAAAERTVVFGKLGQITIKGGTKCVIEFPAHAANLHELYEQADKHVLLVVAEKGDHINGMEDIQGEEDQRGLTLGHEYAPDSVDNGMGGDNE